MSREKKYRNMKRKLQNMKNDIDEWTRSLPVPPDKSPNYLGYRAYSFSLDDNNYDENMLIEYKKEIMKQVIGFVRRLRNKKSVHEKEYRIYCYFTLPDLFYSEVMISYTKAGLNSFYEGLNHDGDFLKNYSVTKNSQFLQKEWGLQIPSELKVRGYDGVGEHKGYSFWLIGDID